MSCSSPSRLKCRRAPSVLMHFLFKFSTEALPRAGTMSSQFLSILSAHSRLVHRRVGMLWLVLALEEVGNPCCS